MIKLGSGNIFIARTEAIVNTVNCVGIMGKGIALQFKMKYPENYKFYKKNCDEGRMSVGNVLIYQRDETDNPKYIINFPTKRHWKGKSILKDIKAGLLSLVAEVDRLKIKSIAIPALGCGLGGLDWQKVKKEIQIAFSKLDDVNVYLYEPTFSPKVDTISVNTKKPTMTLTRALLIKLLEVYQALGYPHSLLEVQKLMYFMDTLLNNELNLQFVKKQYGPYTNKMNHVLQGMENHFTRGYGDRVQKAEIRLLPGAVDEANHFLSDKAEYRNQIERISLLINGFETPFGMELLSTVHWVSTHECEGTSSTETIIHAIYDWSARKKELFKVEHINVAIDRLTEQKWIG